jgi:hypothetical protein
LTFAFTASTNDLPSRAALTQKPTSPATIAPAATVAATPPENVSGASAAIPNAAHEKANRDTPT